MRLTPLALVATVLMALTLGACTEADRGPGWLGTTQGPSTTAHTPPRFGDTVGAWDIEMTVRLTKLPIDDSATIIPGEGEEVALVIASISNTGGKEFHYALTSWEARDQDDRVYRASVGFGDLGLTDGIIPPGESVGGYVGFLLPRGSTLTSVTYRPIDVALSPEYLVWEH